MKKRFWLYGKRFLLIMIVVIFSGITIATVCHDISGSATEIAASNLMDDAEIFTTYFDDMIEERFRHLEQLGKRIDVAIYESSEETKRALEDYKGIFNSLAVLNTDGKQEFGDEINLNLSQEELLETLVYDKKNVVYEGTIRDKGSKEVIVLCVPIMHNTRVSGIIMGTVTVSAISKLMDQWGYSQEGCAFLLTVKGNYLTSGKKFNEILGGQANSYFTYLSNGDLTGDIDSVTDVERKFSKRQAFSIRYSYIGEKFLGALFPSEYGHWYVGYVENANAFYQDSFSLSKNTFTMIVIATIMWIFFVIALMYAMFKNTKYASELERYSLIHEQEKSLIFEFQFSPKRLQFFGDTEAMFGVCPRVLYGEEVYEVYEYVHEDDRSVRGRIHHFYDDDEIRSFVAEVRIKNSNTDSYGWYRISGMLVKDKHLGINLKFIGKIENADEQIAEEKNLVQRAENDLLTGVLNKKTMEEKVTDALGELEGNYRCIFFMVDLDNFKNVNDKLGHIYGDKAIVDTANCLSEIFPNNAYIGRLGGDEFAVCAKYDAFDKESLTDYIKKKAEKICEVNRRTYVNGSVSVSISSSVGIAVAPDFGQDFETIYKMADKALYRSKNGGKNCYHIYQK